MLLLLLLLLSHFTSLSLFETLLPTLPQFFPPWLAQTMFTPFPSWHPAFRRSFTPPMWQGK